MLTFVRSFQAMALIHPASQVFTKASVHWKSLLHPNRTAIGGFITAEHHKMSNANWPTPWI
jgi:hypothetical protein